jgi:hypothetical protein
MMFEVTPNPPRKKGPKITVIGGGTGLPVLLRNLRKRDADVTAVVTVADDGGSSGIIRDYMNVVPPGDIRNCMIALSPMNALQKEIFQYRFNSDDQFFAGHAIGNLIIAALTEMRGNIFDAIRLLSRMMVVEGHVYPAAEEPLLLRAEFQDGTIVDGESKLVKYRKKIKRVSVHCYDENRELDESRTPMAAREVINAIMEADMVVLGPGSLYTSILPNLMISDIGQAVCETKAEVVYICNIMTQLGETEHFTDADHVRVLHDHLGTQFIDTVLVNTEAVPEEYLNQQKNEEYLYQVKYDFQGLRDEGCRVVSSDFIKLREKGVYHDGEKVIDELFRLLQSARIE